MIDETQFSTTPSKEQDIDDVPSEVPAIDAESESIASGQPLSKKAQKKAARQARYAANKLERRVKEKAAKKEKKRLKREAGEEIDIEPRKKVRVDPPGEPFKAKLIIDLGFDDMMTPKEVISLTSQLAYSYNANRRAARPFTSIVFTSLNGKTKSRLDDQSKASYRRWTNTTWWEEGYERLWAENGITEDKISLSEEPKCPKNKIIYLTADTDDELSELKEDEAYIIGGVCDHNRYKNLCRNKALKDGIRSARLPIGKYVSEMKSRKVLTVNQVVEILVKWTETRNWEESFYAVIPKRKLQDASVRSKAQSDDQSGLVEGAEAIEDSDNEIKEGVDDEQNVVPEAPELCHRGEGNILIADNS